MRTQWILLIASLVLMSCAHGAADSGLTSQLVRVGSLERRYYVKPALGKTKAVILAFHGGGGQPTKFDQVAGQFGEAASREGFTVIYPEGLGKQWNDGRAAIGSHQDDVAFFDAILSDLALKNYPVDKVFATGISNGAMFSFRLVCERSERLLAIAPVAAGIPKHLETCHPKSPVSVVQFFGSKDPIVPGMGGAIKLPMSWKNRGEVLSQEAGWTLLMRINGCKAHEKEIYRNAMTSDFSVERNKWVDCPSRISGEHFMLLGAGHTWPGGSAYLPEAMIGPLSKSFMANREILRFFKEKL